MLARVLDILDAFETEADLSVSEIARRIDANRSTAYRQLALLVKRDYLDRDPVTGRFRLGIRLLRLGGLVAERVSIRSVALPIMTQLRDDTGESIGLAIRDGLKRTYIEVVESRHLVRRVQPIGLFCDLFLGAPGKVFLAFMPPEEAGPIIAASGSKVLASGAIVDSAALAKEIELVRTTGVAWSQNEQVAGSAGCAFPVFNHSGEIAASLGLTMPMTRLTPEHRAECIERGRVAAEVISRKLGFPR